MATYSAQAIQISRMYRNSLCTNGFLSTTPLTYYRATACDTLPIVMIWQQVPGQKERKYVIHMYVHKKRLFIQKID